MGDFEMTRCSMMLKYSADTVNLGEWVIHMNIWGGQSVMLSSKSLTKLKLGGKL